MIYIYGDSHAQFSFTGLTLPFVYRYEYSVTMHRIGRDNIIVNFNSNEHNENSILCFAYGEVDCRCHVQRQINAGRNEDEVIKELATNYFNTLKHNIKQHKYVVIVGVIPPTKRIDYESLHGPMTHAFPFVGTDADRVRYTAKLNELLEAGCKEHGYIYFNPYKPYTRDDGTLKYELSDKLVHVGDTSMVLTQFTDLYNTLVSN
jgi:hypothetical protein